MGDPSRLRTDPLAAPLLRIAFFGAGGALSTASLSAAARGHRIVAVVGTSTRRTGIVAHARGFVRDALRRLLSRSNDVERMARQLCVPYLRMRGRADPSVIRKLEQLTPDVICIAGFPWILPASILDIPPLGALNVHTSLLPRHRGSMPMFWVYVHDDRETGVTVHWANATADGGDIVAQESFPLDRGESIRRVHDRSAALGATLLTSALDAVARGDALGTPQDENRATTEPVFHPGSPFVDFQAWDIERVWHVLAGLSPLIREPLTDDTGARVRYGAVLGFERCLHPEPLGSVRHANGALALYCKDGVIHLSRADAAR